MSYFDIRFVGKYFLLKNYFNNIALVVHKAVSDFKLAQEKLLAAKYKKRIGSKLYKFIHLSYDKQYSFNYHKQPHIYRNRRNEV